MHFVNSTICLAANTALGRCPTVNNIPLIPISYRHRSRHTLSPFVDVVFAKTSLIDIAMDVPTQRNKG